MQKDFSRETPCPAGFWVRFAAYLADSILVGAGLLVVRLVLSGLFSLVEQSFFGGNVLFQYTWKDIILYLLGAGYYVLCLYYTGTTVGKRLFQLQVIPDRDSGGSSGGDGYRLAFVDVLYRETVGKFLSGLFLCAGFLMAGLGREKRALHDILCDTRVVYRKRIKTAAPGMAPSGKTDVPPSRKPDMPPSGPPVRTPGGFGPYQGPREGTGRFAQPGPYQAFERGTETEDKEV